MVVNIADVHENRGCVDNLVLLDGRLGCIRLKYIPRRHTICCYCCCCCCCCTYRQICFWRTLASVYMHTHAFVHACALRTVCIWVVAQTDKAFVELPALRYNTNRFTGTNGSTNGSSLKRSGEAKQDACCTLLEAERHTPWIQRTQPSLGSSHLIANLLPTKTRFHFKNLPNRGPQEAK